MAATAEEAIDQSRSALRVGDAALAVLWLGRGQALGAEVGEITALLGR